MKRTEWTVVFVLLCACWAYGQNAHYSQFQNAPLYLNPALTGSGESPSRAGAIYRSQWSAIHSPYVTYGGFIDTRKKIFGLGLLINQNQAGQASLKSSSIGLNFAIHKKLADGNNRLSAGVNLGLLQERFNPSDFRFDTEYRPGFGYDPSLGNLETFEFTSMRLPDLGVGINWQFNLLEDGPLSGDFGLAFQRVNQPKASFYGDNVSYPMRTSLYGILNFQVASQIDLAPKLMYSRQLEAQQILVGVDLVYVLSELSTLRLGVGSRIGDAIIFYAGLDLDKISFAFSYDNSISELKPIAGQNSAMEISAIFHLGNKRQRAKPKPLGDRDGDGVLDRSDKCPDTPGIKSNKGCPIDKRAVEEPDGEDFDGDGVLDRNDLCPYVFGEVRFQGCNDRDGDGVWDHVDACPVIPGHPNNYGCPVDEDELDSDGDGILDKQDKCVYVKGLKEFFGCPDSDGDRIPDIYDHCPYLKGIPALEGCPKEDAPVERKKIQGEIVEFDTNKSKIKEHYYPLLNRLIVELKFNDEYNVVIEGHTDNEGDDAYNYLLSQKRAAVIQSYLMSKGISADRISTHYYGETKPRNSNGTASGKARNRRTEVIVFKRY
ncbi:MAG: PorP/SprF family type IX secretion system membrane protein [Bacteroidota bacterium]